MTAARYFCGKCGGEIHDRPVKDPDTDVPRHAMCPDLDAKAREIAAGLCEFEAGVLAALAAETPKRWGAAAGQAYEVLRRRRCVTELFAITDLGRAVARVLAEGGGT
jgi:hypothetical protein